MDFSKLTEKKTDQELEEYLSNIMAYRREIIEAVVAELKKRGRSFSEEELNSIEARNKEREDTVGKSTITVSKPFDENIVDDESSPKLYSNRIIVAFSILFGVLFASILMVINLSILRKKKGIIPVLIFGILFTIAQVLFYEYIISNSSIRYYTYIINAIGAMVLSPILWNKFIGKETKYRAKSFVIPLIIGLAITAFNIYTILTV